MRNSLIVVAVVMSAASSYGSGFALYQPSAVSHAMGGALLGKAMDASANFNNPATLTDLTNLQFTVGFITEHPRGRVDVGKYGSVIRELHMDPGMFVLPHFQLAVPLPAGFSFGFGMEPDYGLGTAYDDTWPMAFSATDTKIQSMVLTPNIAYKVTDDWSVAAGLRWTYFEFEQYSMPQVVQNGVELGNFSNRLRGDNGFKDFGWQVGTKYDITKTFSVGAVYKSCIDVSVDGKTSNNVRYWNERGIDSMARAATYQKLAESGIPPSMVPSPVMESYVSAADSTIRKGVNSAAMSRTGRAGADITLPQSVAVGFNWDITTDWHLGGMLSWTQWSKFDTLHFDLEGGDKDIPLRWEDTWRGSLGVCWNFVEDWRWMASYTYDMDSTSPTQASVMLPPADRHILATGFTWNCWGGLELALSYACIFMEGGSMSMTDSLGERYYLSTCYGFCHAGGFSITYRF